MLKSVFVTNHHGERYELPLSNPDASGFLIKNISGMGPVKTSINTSSGALSPGEFFNSSKIEKRNIVIDLDYYPDSGLIENQRLQSYRLFEVNTPVDIEFLTDKNHVVAHGYVESNEPTIFSQNCGTSISIVCPDPYLYSKSDKRFSMSNLVRAFKFQFKNPDPYNPPYDLDEDPRMEPTLMMGYYDKNSIKSLYNEGNASNIGVLMRIVVGSAGLSNFVFGNISNGKTFTLNDDVVDNIVPDGILEHDEILVNSTRGHKSIILRRRENDSYKEYNILPAKEYNSDWLTIDAGENNIYYYCNGGNDTADVSLTYTPAFLGV